MDITTATVSEVRSVQDGPYERSPRDYFWICNLISRNSFLGSLNMNITTATASHVPGIQGGPNERRPLDFFFWDL